MAKGIYAGVGGVAHRCKKMYVGIGGVARKVKKGYVGIGGVARPFYGIPELTYYGKIAALSQARRSAVSATVGNYIIIAGGEYVVGNYSYYATHADAYTSSLVKTDVAALASDCIGHTSATVGQYALFAGGRRRNANYLSTVNVYNAALVKQDALFLSEAKYCYDGGISIGNHAIIAGQEGVKVDAFDDNLVRKTLTPFTHLITDLTSARIGNYALITGGGNGIQENKKVYGYTANLVQITTELSEERGYNNAARGATVGQYALFGGGTSLPSLGKDLVDVFNASLVRSNIRLSEGRTGHNSASPPGLALFTGGSGGTSYPTYQLWSMESYDENLTRQPSVTVTSNFGCTGVIGNYVLAAGGSTNPPTPGTYTADVDVYVVL